jgi:amidase
MSRSAFDLTDLFDVIAGPDEMDTGRGYRLSLPAARHTGLRDFRILVIDYHPMMPVASSIREAIDKLAGQLSRAGAKVARESTLMPDIANSSRLYMRLLLSVLTANLPPEAHETMRENAAKLKPDDMSLSAERLRGAVMSHREWIQANALRGGLRAQWRALFHEFDAVLCPTMPTPAFPHDHTPNQNARRIVVDNQEFPYNDQLVWPGIATCPGLPSTAIPIALSSDGLPIGVQLVGPWLEDRTPLKLAELIEQNFGGFVPPPGFA